MKSMAARVRGMAMFGPKRLAAFATVAALVAAPAAAPFAQEAPKAAAQEAPAAHSPSPEEAAAQLAGAYHLTNADGDRSCTLTLSGMPLRERGKDPARAAAFTVEFDRAACAAQILFSADIASWSPGPGNAIRLYNGEGRLTAEFTEGVGGTWEALRETDGVYFLVNPRIADPAAQPADIVGQWELTRTGGNARCRIGFLETPAPADAFRLAPEPGCAPLLGRTLPERWRLDRGDLVLETANGSQLRFAPNEEGGWMKVPEEARPLVLNRAP